MNRAARAFSWSASVASRRRNVGSSVDSEARQTWISRLANPGVAAGDDHSIVEFISAVSRECYEFVVSVLCAPGIGVWSIWVVRPYPRERYVCVYHSLVARVKVPYAFMTCASVTGQ